LSIGSDTTATPESERPEAQVAPEVEYCISPRLGEGKAENRRAPAREIREGGVKMVS
jgi:hypothetical protein